MKKIKSVILCFVALLLISGHAFAAEVKIGYVNLQRALNESDAGIKAKETLSEESKKYEDELTAKQEEIKKLRDEIEKKGNIMNKEAKDAKEKEWKIKTQDLQNQYAKYSEELAKNQREKEAEIIESLRAVVDEVSARKGYTYIFERSVGGLLVAPADADITDEVIKNFNKKKASR